MGNGQSGEDIVITRRSLPVQSNTNEKNSYKQPTSLSSSFSLPSVAISTEEPPRPAESNTTNNNGARVLIRGTSIASGMTVGNSTSLQAKQVRSTSSSAKNNVQVSPSIPKPTNTTPKPTNTIPEPTSTTPEPRSTTPEPRSTTPEPRSTTPEQDQEQDQEQAPKKGTESEKARLKKRMKKRWSLERPRKVEGEKDTTRAKRQDSTSSIRTPSAFSDEGRREQKSMEEEKRKEEQRKSEEEKKREEERRKEEKRKEDERKQEEKRKEDNKKRAEAKMEEESLQVPTGLHRSRGYTHIGISSFFPPQNDQITSQSSRPPLIVPSQVHTNLEQQMHHSRIAALAKAKEEEKKKVDARKVARAQDEQSEIEREKEREKEKERVLSTLASARSEEMQQETRPRRNSFASFGPGDSPNPSQTSGIIAALKRASQRIEMNLKAKLAKPKIETVRTPQDKAAMKIQATFRMWIAVKSYKNHLQRASVVREILITELDYVRFLSVLVKVYYYPLRKANILTQEEINAIFPQVEIIKIYNSKFAEALQKKMRVWNVYQTIGDAFLSMVDVMREPYAIYISQFPDISATISSCSRRAVVADFLKKCTKFTEVASMDLLSLASMPFQRIPRYILLLKECLKSTSKSHRDYELIRVAIKKLDSLTHAASERLRMTESSKSVVRISEMCDPPVENLVRAYRKLLRDGFIDAQYIPAAAKAKDHPQIKNTRLFLFTDCLLIAKPINKSFFGTKEENKLKPITVLDLRGAVLLDVDNPPNEFRLRVQAGLAIFQTKNWPEKEAWKSDLTDAIILLSEDTHHHTEVLPRSASVQIESPVNREKLSRAQSQLVTPQSSSSEPDKNTKKESPRRPRPLSRKITLPQIAVIFQPQKLAAPKVNRSARLIIGRAASYNSFFMEPGTTHRKPKATLSSPSPSLAANIAKLRKAQSLPLILKSPLKSVPSHMQV